MLSGRDDLGIGATIDIDDVSTSQKTVVACLLAVAIWNGIEMLPIIYFTFTRFAGLYFWSMIAATMGALIYAAGFVLNNFQLTGNQTLPTILTCSAWIPMVSAQSLVLYSRLHLVNLDESIRRWVLIMIIFNGVTMHTATIITTIGSNSKSAELFIKPYAIMERIQVCVFFVQELILSCLYVWKAHPFLNRRKGKESQSYRKLRGMVVHLILSSVIIISLDITILVLEFMGLYFIQVAYKAFVYSVKLKCEVGILNRLVDFVKSTSPKRHHVSSSQDWDSFQLGPQAEQEWESTLRNTFGGAPMTDREKVDPKHNTSSLVGSRGVHGSGGGDKAMPLSTLGSGLELTPTGLHARGNDSTRNSFRWDEDDGVRMGGVDENGNLVFMSDTMGSLNGQERKSIVIPQVTYSRETARDS